MSDDLPRLLPDDPENLLSYEARKRIQRAQIESDRFIWEAEDFADEDEIDEEESKLARSEASKKKAKNVLSVMHEEYSRLRLPEPKFRECMKLEIESACNSLQISEAQRHAFESQFYFPKELEEHPQNVPPVRAVESKKTTIGEQIKSLCEECKLTPDDLAEKMELDFRTVQRHMAGDMVPYNRHRWRYEKLFSMLLKRQVVISKTP
jgi:ribosome-binding protein aMBF1 (putative translation factor)